MKNYLNKNVGIVKKIWASIFIFSLVFQGVILPTRVQAVASSVDAVIDQISALPAVANLTLPGTEVSSARTAYEALNSGQKLQVTNLATLVAAENQVIALTSAESAVASLE